MEVQVLHSSWDLVLLLWLYGRLFAEMKLLQKDVLKPLKKKKRTCTVSVLLDFLLLVCFSLGLKPFSAH